MGATARTMNAVPAALVTGASSGIGRAFARRLAVDGHDLVLVARDRSRLEDLAAELRQRCGIAVEVVAADLTDRMQLQAVADRVASTDRPVAPVVNAAGYTLRRPFPANDLRVEEALLDVHVRAPMVLTHAAVTAMQPRGRGAVINISSVGAWVPQGSYSAHKAWVYRFSQAIAAQTARFGVRVMVVMPGFVRTELHQRAGTLEPDRVPAVFWLDPDEVAAGSLRALAAGKRVYVPGTLWRVVSGVLRHAPIDAIARVRLRGRRRPGGVTTASSGR
jgi:short-subunit dehydrogenase